MLNTFRDSSRFWTNFENRVLPSYVQRVFLCKFFWCTCPIDAIDTPLDRYRSGTPFICRILYLIPYSLRATLILLKRETLFFAEPKSTKWTASDGQPHCIIGKQKCTCFSRIRNRWSELHPSGNHIAMSNRENCMRFLIHLSKLFCSLHEN